METKTESTDPIAVGGDGAAARSSVIELPQATHPQDVPAQPELDNPSLYFNRELSWLDFNRRVLHLAQDERIPLLERVRFLAITSSNLDEFFRKRVGGLKRQIAAGVRRLSPDGRTPEEQMKLISDTVPAMYRTICDVWHEDLRPLLAEEAGINIRDYEDLTEDERASVHNQFMANIFPILTPLAVDPGHPFPFISNQSMSLAVMLRHPKRDTEHFARIKIPTSRGRWLPLDEPNTFVPVEQVVAHNVQHLFRGMEVLGAHCFRITRNADLRRDEEEADDLIEMISEELRERRSAPVVRIEISQQMPEDVRHLLMDELELDPLDIFETPYGFIDHTDLFTLADLDIPEHKYDPWEPVIPARLKPEGDTQEPVDIFKVIKQSDVLVHHPYETFQASVQHFIESAAEDPHVLAIKLTLYRTSSQSPIIKALIRAAESGKQVAVLVEVKARFDEQNNIEWAQVLEKSGVHVAYGLVGLKTHTKVTLVVREEEGGLRTYCHIGTGNYNPKTATLYTDLGLLTADHRRGYDVIDLFHYLTGYAAEPSYAKLLVAPRDMRDGFIELLHREIANQKAYGNGRVIAQMNALDDVEMIQELYRASQKGVMIDLIVRGHCRLRPGLPGLSENIRVISILGRFLEHCRIYLFGNNNQPRVFLGSADWMRRNLDDRIEVVTEVESGALRSQLIETLRVALDDQWSAWELKSSGHYVLPHPDVAVEGTAYQDVMMRRAIERRESETDDIGGVGMKGMFKSEA